MKRHATGKRFITQSQAAEERAERLISPLLLILEERLCLAD